MNVILSSDETGRHLRDVLAEFVRQAGHDVEVVGADCYPEASIQAAIRVVAMGSRAILICGTGIGVCMAANKVRGAWAGTCSDPEQAARLVSSNGGNILCIGCGYVSTQKAKKIVTAFLAAEFQHRPNALRMREMEERK